MNILAECDRRGIRLEANGDMLKVDAPKGAMTDELKERLRANKADILRQLVIDQADDPRAPAVDVDAILAEACHGVHGIDAATFRALLSPEDVQDIEGGHISPW